MSNTIETVRTDLSSKFPSINFDYSFANHGNILHIPKEYVVLVLKHFKQSGRFDFLMNISGVDYPERTQRFDVVYELFSTRTSERLRVKTQVGEFQKTVDKASSTTQQMLEGGAKGIGKGLDAAKKAKGGGKGGAKK